MFLLNKDAYLESNTVERLIKYHKENTDLGILSSIQLNGDGTKFYNNNSKYISLNIRTWFKKNR